MNLTGKVAVVTGGSKGIGKAISLKLAAKGAKVVVNQEYNNDSSVFIDKVVNEINDSGGEAIGIEADVSIKMEVQALIDETINHYGRIDIMIANAGICPFEEFLKIDEQLLDKVIGVNQKGAFFCAQSAMKKMIELNIQGRIVFTSSVSAIFGGEYQAHYTATKGAINQIMKSVAISAGKFGITVNAIQPGTVITDINKKELNEDSELLKDFIKRTPIGRLVTPEEVANAVCFFASSNSSGITGTTLTIDGGMSIKMQ